MLWWEYASTWAVWTRTSYCSVHSSLSSRLVIHVRILNSQAASILHGCAVIEKSAMRVASVMYIRIHDGSAAADGVIGCVGYQLGSTRGHGGLLYGVESRIHWEGWGCISVRSTSLHLWIDLALRWHIVWIHLPNHTRASSIPLGLPTYSGVIESKGMIHH